MQQPNNLWIKKKKVKVNEHEKMKTIIEVTNRVIGTIWFTLHTTWQKSSKQNK